METSCRNLPIENMYIKSMIKVWIAIVLREQDFSTTLKINLNCPIDDSSIPLGMTMVLCQFKLKTPVPTQLMTLECIRVNLRI